MKIFSSEHNSRPLRSRIGEYDNQLLCPECEASLSEYDGYAHQILYRTKPTHITQDGGEDLAATYEQVDIGRLRVFFVTLMWRMHATSRPMFKSVKLGSLETDFRTGALTKDPSAVSEMDVVVQKFDRQSTGIIGPTRFLVCGLAGYRVCFSGYSCWIKVDPKPIVEPFDEVALSSGTSLKVLLKDYFDSPERSLLKKIVRRNLE